MVESRGFLVAQSLQRSRQSIERDCELSKERRGPDRVLLIIRRRVETEVLRGWKLGQSPAPMSHAHRHDPAAGFLAVSQPGEVTARGIFIDLHVASAPPSAHLRVKPFCRWLCHSANAKAASPTSLSKQSQAELVFSLQCRPRKANGGLMLLRCRPL